MSFVTCTYIELLHYLLHSDGLQPEVRMTGLLHCVLVCLRTTSHLHALTVHRALTGSPAAHVRELLLAVRHVLHLVVIQLAKIQV
jgi:hypothetical protein